MKTFFQISCFFLLITQICFAQWVHTNLPDSVGVSCFAVSGTNLFAGTGDGGVFLSTDNGTSWTPINEGLPKQPEPMDTTRYVAINRLEISGTTLFAGTWGGGVLLSTNNGISWTEVNNGLTNLDIFALAVSGTNIFVGIDEMCMGGGVFLSTNNGTNWTETGLGDTGISALAVSGTNIFAATFPGLCCVGKGIYLSTNNGTSWVNTILPTSGVWGASALAILGTNVFAGTNKGVYLTTDNGNSWAITGYTGNDVCSFAVSNTNLFAGADEMSLWGGVFLSTDSGTSWKEVNSGLPHTSVTALAVSGTNLFAGTYWGVWRRPLSEMIVPVELISFTASANGKEVILNWSTATELNNYGFEIQRKTLGGDFATVAFVKGQGTTTQKNQYSFADKNLDEGKYSYRLKQLDMDGKFEYSNIVEVEVISITSYSLEQNYPNPFNPSTTISYGLKEKSNAKLTMLNSLGEEIAVLVNEEQDKGYHKVEFNGSKLPSGVYFYQLKAGSFIETKKMILLR